MAGKKEILARQKLRTVIHGFPNSADYPFDSAMRRILEQAEKNKGLIKVNNTASYDGKGISLSDLVSCLHILTDPTHRENRWSCLVEMVKYDDDIYLRLVPSIPLEVKVKWEATGKPPKQMVSNDAGFILETLKQALPPKPAAKTPPARKANPVPEQAPAKTPEQLAEEALSRVIETAEVGSPEYNRAVAKRTAMRFKDVLDEKIKKGHKF